ncbi:caspase family protein [Roseibium sp. Sym1]|uniref:caspase family protein n=1 Tax=Roseibium sp. Sym1 TaxID=3016006 RepID=UPI0022B4E0D1|nr:caspase family protein [Roseibium sp. Sym1]
MKPVLVRLLLPLIVALCTVSAARAASTALIIGNSAYQDVTPLDNPTHDADLAARTFAALGFDTVVVLDADAATMRAALAEFKTRAADAEIAAIFYAGHGVQANNVNYLLPTDTGAATKEQFEQTAIRMEEFLDALSATTGVKLLIVDACRDNPFAATRALARGFKSDSKGLARVNHQLRDLMVVYSAQPDHQALDGDGDNSPFMEAFSAVLTAKDSVRLTEALIDITNFVRTKTANKQLPYTEGTLSVHVQLTRQEPLQTAAEPPVCPADGEVLSLRDLEDYVEFDDGPSGLVVSDAGTRLLELCPKDGGILVHGRFDQHFSPADLRDPVNEGAGYYFKTGDGSDAHLWFYAEEDAEAPAQIGIYVNGDEITWISTGWVF